MPIPPEPAPKPAVLPRHADNFPHKKTGISRKNERRPARKYGLYLKQLRCDSSLCRYEKTIRPEPCRAMSVNLFSRLPDPQKGIKKPP